MSDEQEAVIGGEAIEHETEESVEPVRALDEQWAERERAVAARLRDALLASAPGITPDDVRGDTVEEVEASFEAAQSQLVPPEAPAVPAGAPGRVAHVPGTAFEKIREGLTSLHEQ